MLNKQKISVSALMAILLLQGLLFAVHHASAGSLAKAQTTTGFSENIFSGSADGQIASSPSIPGSGYASINQKRFHSGFHDRGLSVLTKLNRESKYFIFSVTDFKLLLQSTNTFPLHLFYCVLQI